MPAFGIEAVRIEGLRAARRHFREVDVGFINTQKEMTLAIAKEVADTARPRAVAYGSSMAKGAKSIKAFSTASTAGLRFGGTKAPWMAGAEFGSDRYQQFPAWRGNTEDAGYVIFPTIRSMRARIEELALQFVERLLSIFDEGDIAA